MTQNLTTRNYDLREIDSERLIDSNEAIKKLDAYNDLMGIDLKFDNNLRCYIGDKILIQIQTSSVARVSSKGDIEQKLTEITNKTGVRFY